MEKKLPPPIPGLTSASVAQMVRESGVIAAAFAEDFEKLMSDYRISEYKISVKCELFELDFGNKDDSNN